MEVQVIQGAQYTIKVDGEIDLSNVDRLKAAFDEAIKESPCEFVVDMSDVSYLDSAGVQALLYAYRQVRNKDGKITLIVANPKVKLIFDIINIDQLPNLVVFDSTQSVLS